MHGIVVLLDRAHDVMGTEAVGHDGLTGKVLAGGNLLQRRRVDHDVGVLDGRADIAVIANIPDPELEHILEVVEDHLIRCNVPMQVGHAHVVLLRLVA